MLTQAELKQLLHYDPETGLFTRLTSPTQKIKIGDIAGFKCNGYIRITLNYKSYAAHRLAWLYVYGSFPKNQIDHINQDRSDNRINNLRDVTVQQNAFNLPLKVTNKHGYTGIEWHKNMQKYRAQIKINYKSKHLGYFDCPKEAHQAYLKAKAELHII